MDEEARLGGAEVVEASAAAREAALCGRTDAREGASSARPSGLTLYPAQNSGPLRGKAATRQGLGPFLEIPLPGVSGKMRSFFQPGAPYAP